MADDVISYHTAFQEAKDLLTNGRGKLLVLVLSLLIAGWIVGQLSSISAKVDALDKRVERVERKLDQ